MLEDSLSNIDININLSNNSAHLEKMDKQEKAELLNLLKNYDEGQDYSLLETLIENDSPNVSRPADLLLYRACAPKTNAEYYIYHFSWLIDREFNKKVTERDAKIDEINFKKLFQNHINVLAKENRININFGNEPNKKIIDALTILGLIDVEGGGSNSDYFFDLSAPSVRGLLLVAAGGYQRSSQVSLDKLTETFDFAACVAGLFVGEYKRIMEKCMQNILHIERVHIIRTNLFRIMWLSKCRKT